MAVQNLILPFHLNGQYPFFGLSGAVEVGEFSGQEQMIDWKENWHSPTATTIPTSNCHLVNTHPICHKMSLNGKIWHFMTFYDISHMT